jgi:hypothetical protein
MLIYKFSSFTNFFYKSRTAAFSRQVGHSPAALAGVRGVMSTDLDPDVMVEMIKE